MSNEERKKTMQARELTPEELQNAAGGQKRVIPIYDGSGRPLDFVCQCGHVAAVGGNFYCPECGRIMDVRQNTCLNQAEVDQYQAAIMQEAAVKAQEFQDLVDKLKRF